MEAALRKVARESKSLPEQLTLEGFFVGIHQVQEVNESRESITPSQ